MRKLNLLIMVVGLLCFSLDGKETVMGQAVPDFKLTDSSGKQWTLTALQQKEQKGIRRPILLMFWCTTCGSCRRVEKQLSDLSRAMKDKALVVALTVNRGETAEKGRAFTQKKNLSFPVFADPSGKAADLFAAKQTTLSVVIDKEGILRFRGGFSNGKTLFAQEALTSVVAGEEVKIKKATGFG